MSEIKLNPQGDWSVQRERLAADSRRLARQRAAYTRLSYDYLESIAKGAGNKRLAESIRSAAAAKLPFAMDIATKAGRFFVKAGWGGALFAPSSLGVDPIELKSGYLQYTGPAESEVPNVTWNRYGQQALREVKPLPVIPSDKVYYTPMNSTLLEAISSGMWSPAKVDPTLDNWIKRKASVSALSRATKAIAAKTKARNDAYLERVTNWQKQWDFYNRMAEQKEFQEKLRTAGQRDIYGPDPWLLPDPPPINAPEPPNLWEPDETLTEIGERLDELGEEIRRRAKELERRRQDLRDKRKQITPKQPTEENVWEIPGIHPPTIPDVGEWEIVADPAPDIPEAPAELPDWVIPVPAPGPIWEPPYVPPHVPEGPPPPGDAPYGVPGPWNPPTHIPEPGGPPGDLPWTPETQPDPVNRPPRERDIPDGDPIELPDPWQPPDKVIAPPPTVDIEVEVNPTPDGINIKLKPVPSGPRRRTRRGDSKIKTATQKWFLIAAAYLETAKDIRDVLGIFLDNLEIQTEHSATPGKLVGQWEGYAGAASRTEWVRSVFLAITQGRATLDFPGFARDLVEWFAQEQAIGRTEGFLKNRARKDIDKWYRRPVSFDLGHAL